MQKRMRDITHAHDQNRDEDVSGNQQIPNVNDGFYSFGHRRAEQNNEILIGGKLQRASQQRDRSEYISGKQ